MARRFLPQITRRAVLSGPAALGALATIGARAATPLAAPRPHAPFRFAFVTDAHIEPELNAAAGTRMCFRRVAHETADFVIQGGDHVFDALGVNHDRAQSLMDLYTMTEQVIGKKVHHTIGNHDLYGIYTKSGATPGDLQYGKAYYRDHFGPTYYSFDHKGVHFITLDSIGVTADRSYEGRIDADQIAWLTRDLERQPAGTPIIVTSHIPLVTGFACYSGVLEKPTPHNNLSVVNAAEIVHLLRGYNVLAVLQGHTHVNEVVTCFGIPFITGGAVSGNWWKGVHLGTPEGYTMVSVADNRVTTEYRTYGFRSVDPHDT
ncbi:metallophosphoesterase family protein [Tanticharoenia sakaeratensis]|uniref:Metallophosphoesterase n=1 Tax=Tanticharoenia sakaeratensis NBRC 103193 TaxID=1231623 RepID=A0A0D6MME8_9PROT|nr:metallophosphoesterase [Tanticharoenia sakaeratensis]GAN54849.1 metallophosphoesterase [Tanticharoenia sakaeratensis NBRC 103193]